MEEKLIDLLITADDYEVAVCKEYPCKYCKYRGEDCTYKARADHLIANGVTVQKWIPVSERLPEENTAVLTYRESGIQAEFRWHKGWDNDEFTPCQVTHWMPLPEAPKGE